MTVFQILTDHHVVVPKLFNTIPQLTYTHGCVGTALGLRAVRLCIRVVPGARVTD